MENIKGKVVQVLEKKTGVGKMGKEWASQAYIIEKANDDYNKFLCIELFGNERIEEYAIKVGDDLLAEIEFSSNEWNGNWFTKAAIKKVYKENANAGRVQQSAPKQQVAQPQAVAPQPTQQAQFITPSKEDDDSLPF